MLFRSKETLESKLTELVDEGRELEKQLAELDEINNIICAPLDIEESGHKQAVG